MAKSGILEIFLTRFQKKFRRALRDSLKECADSSFDNSFTNIFLETDAPKDDTEDEAREKEDAHALLEHVTRFQTFLETDAHEKNLDNSNLLKHVERFRTHIQISVDYNEKCAIEKCSRKKDLADRAKCTFLQYM